MPQLRCFQQSLTYLSKKLSIGKIVCILKVLTFFSSLSSISRKMKWRRCSRLIHSLASECLNGGRNEVQVFQGISTPTSSTLKVFFVNEVQKGGNEETLNLPYEELSEILDKRNSTAFNFFQGKVFSDKCVSDLQNFWSAILILVDTKLWPSFNNCQKTQHRKSLPMIFIIIAIGNEQFFL